MITERKLQRLFCQHVPRVAMPAVLVQQVRAQVLAEVAVRLTAEERREDFCAGYEAGQQGDPYNVAESSDWKNGWVRANKYYDEVNHR